jgi:F-type H+-transporting ATPase subunit b
MSRLLAFLVGVLLPIAALADEVEHAGQHAVPWAKLVFSSINFAIFLYLMSKLIGSLNLGGKLADRRAQIVEALAQAERAKQEAEALRLEWQRRMENLAAELEAMLQQARADIATERDQILAAAHRTAEAIRRDAERTAENEIRGAQEALRAEVAKQALAIAERLAPQRLSAADQQRFVREFVAEVSE